MKKRILVVDDVAEVREMVSQILRQQGFEVIEAGCALEALSIVKQPCMPVDLVVCDVQMPSVNGFELAGMLQSERPGCRVLLISGSMPEEWEQTYPLLRKPFGPLALAEGVKRALQEIGR